VRVIVADDAVLLREGLVRILREDGYDVVAVVGDAPSLVQSARVHQPDLVVSDVRMPPNHRDDGIVAVRELRRDRPDLPIVLLSQYLEAGRALDLFRENPAGLGYLLKDRVLQIDEFLDAIRRVAGGGTAVDPQIIAQLVGARPGGNDPLDTLTDRERDVIRLMAQGLSNSGIGSALHLGVRTIETYINAVFIKLGLHVDAEEHRRVKAVLAYLQSARAPSA
jgi:DNA-binding NarL/FixJ family response regulator